MKKVTSEVGFGHEVRRRRESRGMTLDDLALGSGLTPNYIGSIELGYRDPSLSTILALAKGFGVRPGELFPSATGFSTATDEAARLFEHLSSMMQASIIGLLKAVQAMAR